MAIQVVFMLIALSWSRNMRVGMLAVPKPRGRGVTDRGVSSE